MKDATLRSMGSERGSGTNERRYLEVLEQIKEFQIYINIAVRPSEHG